MLSRHLWVSQVVRRTHCDSANSSCMNKFRINPLGNGSVMWQLSVVTNPLLYGSQLLTAAAWLHFQGSPCGILGGRSGTGRSFCLGILLIRGSIIPPMLHILSCIIWGTDGQSVRHVPLIPPSHGIKQKAMLRRRGIICSVGPTVFIHVYRDPEQRGRRKMNTKNTVLCKFLLTFSVLFPSVAMLHVRDCHHLVLDRKHCYRQICKGFYFRL
jgi:hypothetical protein